MTEQTGLTEVTAEQWAIVLPDLEKLLKTKQKAGETLPAYALRLAKGASDPKKITDDMWDTLEEVTQFWVNGANEADEKHQPVPLPPGMAAAPETEDGGRTADAKKPARTSAKNGAARALAKKKDAPAVAPAKAAAKNGQRGRPSKYGDKDVISLTTTENPHRKGSKDFDKFRKLKEGQTVAKALASGVEVAYLRYLTERRGLITIAPPAA